MRKRFEQQLILGRIPIAEVVVRTKTRHQLADLLLALQYIFVTPSLSEQVFEILEGVIPKTHLGRKGLTLWEILVLACVRLNLNIDYDFLVDLANDHRSIRGILGVAHTDFSYEKEYAFETVRGTVSLLDETVINKISLLVVQAGHELLKKKRPSKQIKTPK